MMFLLLSLLCGLTQATKFVSYIGQAGPGWGNPGSNADFLKYIGVPGYGGDLGYNVLNFAFWVSNSNNGGAAVNGAAYDWQNILSRITDSSLRTTLTGSSNPTAAELRAGIKSLYSSAGIDICISAFGGADHPMGNGKNAVTTGQSLATYAKDYDYDCVDVDWEEAYYGYFGASAGGEEWLCSLTETLYSNLDSSQYITHAPQAPYFMGSTGNQYPNGGYNTVHKNCGDKIAWYNVQFYNQGSTTYNTYSGLFENSIGWSGNSAVYEIMDGASSENVQVPAEKIVVGKHTQGDGSTFVDGPTLKSIFNDALAAGRWSTGFMTWQLYREIASTDKLITEVLEANWPASVPTPPTTARPTYPPSPSPAPTMNPIRAVTGNIEIVNFGTSTSWYYACNIQESKYTVSAVEILMSNNAWFGCQDASYAWKCGVTSQISYPLSIRVSGGGETLTGYSVITSPNDGLVFDLGYNFGASAVIDDDDDDTEEDGEGEGDEEQTTTSAVVPVVTPSPPSGSGSYITITTATGSGEWWYSCSLSNVPGGITIRSVKMKHANSLTWETGSYKSWSGGVYVFSNTAPFTPPLSFKIRSTDGQTITTMDVIPSYAVGSSGTMTESFSASYLYEDVDSTKNGPENTLWVFVALAICLVIGAVVFLVMRRRRAKTRVYFDDSNDVEVSEMATDRMVKSDGVHTAGVVKAVEDENEVEHIVVEVEAHQPMTGAGSVYQ